MGYGERGWKRERKEGMGIRAEGAKEGVKYGGNKGEIKGGKERNVGRNGTE